MEGKPDYGSLGPVLRITPWERDALQLLANGTAAVDVASDLGIAASDVESRLTRLFAAMGAASQTEAIAIALKRGLLRMEVRCTSREAV
jgi:two-component system, NarL family, response regulator YdfI